MISPVKVSDPAAEREQRRAARGRRGDAQPSARSGDESDGAGRKTAADYVRERDARELRRKILQNCL